jgi:valyl-tRNA synthetase
MIKPSLYQKEDRRERAAVQHCMARVLKSALELLHPIMPFVTEEIWQKLPQAVDSITVSTFPAVKEEEINPEAESDMEVIMQTVIAIRNVRSEMNVPPASRPAVDVQYHRATVKDILDTNRTMVCTLAGLASLAVHESFQKPQGAVAAVIDGAEIFLPLAGLVDFSEEKRRLAKEMQKVLDDLAFINKKLSNRDFLGRAPQEIIEKEKARVAGLKEKETRLRENFERIAQLCQ